MLAAASMATSAQVAPSSQTMDSSFLSPPLSNSHSDSISRSSSLSRTLDHQDSGSFKSEEYRQLFRLPPQQVLLQDFNCALQENILLQGHMYLFDRYICFYSNIFGFETKKIIALQEVTCVQRAKTAGIFPNAIEIVAAGKKHFFASFLSRDEAFKIIYDGWSQQGNGQKGVLDQDTLSETSSQMNGGCTVDDNILDSQVSILNSEERNLEAARSEDTNLPQNQEEDVARAAASASIDTDVVEDKEDAAVDTEPSSSVSVKWDQETRDAPEIQKCYIKLAEARFPINVEGFFNLFFSDVAFVDSYHKKCGDKDFRCSSWSPHDEYLYTREITFQHPIKIYLGARCGGCKESQKLRVYKNSHLVVETSQEVSDVPYADYFQVEGIWDVQKDDEQSGEGCVLQVYVNVAFSKKTMWRGKIEQSTKDECREAYAIWISLAHELLKERKIEKPEETNTLDPETTGQQGESDRLLLVNAEPVRTVYTEINSPVTLEQSDNPLQGNLIGNISSRSLFRAVAMKCDSFLKRKGNLQLVLVIAFSVILLLMQLSIVVLLRRPQVHIIPQVDHVTSERFDEGGQRVSEAMHWIEKRMYLLKDEMLVVGAQLERMRNEHIMLKGQLNDLQSLTRKQS